MRGIAGAILLAMGCLWGALGAASSPQAADEAALAKYESGDYAAAYAICSGLARAGNARAQYYVGLMHVMGQGVARDAAVGVDWLKRAADQGFVDAASSLGNMYASGLGVQMDGAQALMWLEQAAAMAQQEEREPECG